MVKLTAELILKKTKLQRLEDVRNLNLFAYDITDAAVLSQVPNVEVLSLSMNRISTLQDFAKCLRLRELYLRRNQVSSLDEVGCLAHLKELRVLWLSDNPCASLPEYHEHVSSMLPQLQLLDNICAPSKIDGTINKHDRNQASTAENCELTMAIGNSKGETIPAQAKPVVMAHTPETSATKPTATQSFGIMPHRQGGTTEGIMATDRAGVLVPGTDPSPVEGGAVGHERYGADASAGRGQLPSIAGIPTSAPSNSSIAVSHVHDAIIHLLAELEGQKDRNALVKVYHDIQCRLERTLQHEIQDNHDSAC
eukprot:jgi/Ulvmu1/7541/UM037_0085.1